MNFGRNIAEKDWALNSTRMDHVGERQADFFHVMGVMFHGKSKLWLRFQYCSFELSCILLKANGNRYEGQFPKGYKNGEGTFYHMNTGQVQKEMWENDICKRSLMQDSFRNQVDKPTLKIAEIRR